jgi:hypothetical protein
MGAEATPVPLCRYRVGQEQGSQSGPEEHRPKDGSNPSRPGQARYPCPPR